MAILPLATQKIPLCKAAQPFEIANQKLSKVHNGRKPSVDILYKIYCKQLDFLCNMSYDGIGRLHAKFATHALLGQHDG